MSDPAYEIRPFASIAEYHACIALQEEVWGRGFSERVPLAILKVAQRLGGLAAGAFAADGGLVGFVFGMTGVERGRLVHWSDMLAVRPGLRDTGLGTRLKAYQRDRMRALDVGRVYWTFDPLQSRNAYLNFNKLGIVVREYARDMYGDTDSPLHAGIGTDRFVALWPIATRRVADRLEGRGVPRPDEVADVPLALDAAMEDGLPVPVAPRTDLEAPQVLVTIPGNLDALKSLSLAKAVRWREATRAVLTHYLDRGWEVREFFRAGEVSRYLLAPVSVDERDP
ncbi:MAG: hypothetical protein R3E98_14975 [Gemmatimonadota bacterium]